MSKKISAILFTLSFFGSQVLYIPIAEAATYNFTQSSWTGGATTNTAVHASNQSGWNQLTSTSTVSAGATVTLPSTPYQFIDNLATSTTQSLPAFGGGFNNGSSIGIVSFVDDVATSSAPTPLVSSYGGGFANGTMSASAVTINGSFTNGTSTGSIAFTDGGATSTYPMPMASTTGGGFANGTLSSVSVIGSGATSTVKLVATTVFGTGGTITTSGATTTHTFTSSGTFMPANSGSVKVLVVAGGGGGGSGYNAQNGGGGGAGGISSSIAYSVTANTGIAVVVGAGGAGATGTTAGSSGANSSINNGSLLSATGGGGGGTSGYTATAGGSGGGGSSVNGVAGAGTAGQGYIGGNGAGAAPGAGGGGGGAGGAGGAASGNNAGAGGAGYTYPVTGTTYAGGGGGSSTTGTPGAGVAGGGTGGSATNGVPGGTGAVNTGSGGGGGGSSGSSGANGGNGGSGVVLVSYLTPTISPTSGTFTSAVIDLGAVSTLTTLTVASTAPTGTSITVDFHYSSNNGATWSSWITPTPNTLNNIATSTDYRWVQYRANFTGAVTSTPTLTNVTINYIGALANNKTGSSVKLITNSSLGGTITTSGATTTHTFTSTTTAYTFTPASSLSGALVLAVAGGGAGGSGYNNLSGGGGGAGGLIFNTNYAFTTGSSLAITIGSGGLPTAGASATSGGSGTNTVFGTLTATGGGGGGVYNTTPSSGGSGGGGALYGGAGVVGQGYTGGSGYATDASTGGGGGASSGGSSGISTGGGSGGSGYVSSISGASVTYACGGGGGTSSGTAGAGGSAGACGGAGATGSAAGSNATNNTGGGGGGAGNVQAKNGGTGGSGIVIVAYPTPLVQSLSNTFTSAVIDAGGTATFSTLVAASTTNANSSVAMYARAGDALDTSDASWTGWTTSSPSLASVDISSISNHRYIQYKAVLSTTDVNYTPTLNTVTIYSVAPAPVVISSGSVVLASTAPYTTSNFTSAVIDLGTASSLTSLVAASTTSAGVTSVSVSAREGNVATPDGTWTAWSATTTAATIPLSGTYRYVQYQATLTTNSTSVTPSLDSVVINYTGAVANNVGGGVALAQAGTGILSALNPATIATGANPQSVTVSADGNSVYVTNFNGNTLSQYSRNTTTGLLTALSPATIATGVGPYGITISADGTSVYVTNQSGNTLSQYSRNTSTGLLTALSPATIATGVTPMNVTISANGTSAYVANLSDNTLSQYSRNTTTGLLTALSPATIATGAGPVAVVISANGTSAYVSNFSGSTLSQYSRNTSTGLLTALSPATIATGASPRVVTISADGTSVYVANQSGNTLSQYSRNTSTGLLTALSPATIATGGQPYGVTISVDGNSVYVTNAAGSTLSQYSRDTSTGLLTALSPATIATGANSYSAAISTDGTSVYAANYGSNTLSQYSRNFAYSIASTFTSAVIDLGVASPLTSLVAASSTPTNTAISMNVREGNVAAPDGTWTAWSTASSAASIPLSGNYRYIQYQANLSTTNTAATPILNSVTVNYTQYAASGSLISSKYDSGSAANFIGKISWTGSATSSTEAIKFQVRSSADGVTWSNWCGPSIACTGSDYFTDANNGVALAAGHPLKNGTTDRWVQYQAFLTSGAGVTPVLSSVTVQYAVNAAPDFQSPATASQDSSSVSATWGKVNIGYSVRDIDSNSAANVTQNQILPSFEYSTTSGASWAAIPSGDLNLGATTSKAVNADQTTYTAYTATWAATSTLPNIYNTTMMVRVTANDSEAANNLATSTSAAFTFDSLAPTVAAGNALLDASTTPANIVLTATDGSQMQYRACNTPFAGPWNAQSADAQGNTCSWTSLATILASSTLPFTPTGAPNSQTAYLQVRDAYGNVTSKTLTAPPTPINFIFADISNPAANSYGEYLSWATTTGATAYRLYYATTTSAASAPAASAYALLATPLVSYYTQQIASQTPMSKYWYKVVSVNANTDVSNFATVIGDVPDSYGTALPDTAPVFTSIATSSVLSTSALITVGTDRLASSTVLYGPSVSGVCSYGSTQSTTGFANPESIPLSGLSPSTTYCFTVQAANTSGISNSATSTNETGMLLAFTTSAPSLLPIISNVATSTNSNSFTVTWNVSTSSDSHVTYATNPALANATTTGSVNLIASATAHSVTVLGLNASTPYYFSITSTDGALNSTTATSSNNIQLAATTTATVTDLAPLFTSIATSSVLSTSALITVATNKIASSTIAYGPTVAGVCSTYPFNTSSAGYAATTALQLSGLTPGVTYCFEVTAQNTIGASSLATTTNEAGLPLAFTTLSANSISATSTSSINNGAFTVNWTTASSSDSYISYSTNSSLTNALTTGNAALTTSHSVIVSGLNPGTTYYYAIRSTDGTGAAITSPSAGTYNILTTTDIAPAISAIATSSVLSTSALITFTTDKLATSTIQYGTGGTCGAYTTNQGSVSTSAFSLNQSIPLSGLTPNTPYSFCVKSMDVAGTISTATSTTGTGLPLAFTTSAATILPTISNVATSTNNDSFTVSWNTAVSSDSFISYATSTAFVGATTTGSATLVPLTGGLYLHQVAVKGLSSGTGYYFSITSTDGAGDSVTDANSGAYYAATTTTDIAPTIGSIATSTLANSALITFSTNKNATSTVLYGTASSTCAYAAQQSTSGFTTFQSIPLSSLTAGTTYYFCLEAMDEAGTVSTALPGGSFTTLGGPHISNVRVGTTTATTAAILWDTATSSDSSVSFATATSNGALVSPSKSGNASSTIAHQVLLSNLTPLTPYYFSVQSIDASGNTALDTNATTFYTIPAARDLIPPVITNVTAPVKSTVAAALVWQTDKLATSQVFYGTAYGVYTNQTILDTTPSIYHVMTLSSTTLNAAGGATDVSVSNNALIPSTQYFFAVVSTDASGNTATSTSNFFTNANSIDVTPPNVLSLLVPSQTLKSTSAVVTFTTDKVATSTVQYAVQGSGVWITVEDTNYTLTHSVTLSGLTSNTSYDLRVRAGDAVGNVSAYTVGPTFTTTGGPLITAILPTNLTDTGATITWNTSTSSDSYVFYATTMAAGVLVDPQTVGSATMVALSTTTNAFTHSVTFSSLLPNTLYYYSVKSTDGNGDSTTAVANTPSFSTTIDTTPPVISNIAAPVQSAFAAVITWQTNELSTSQVEYNSVASTTPGTYPWTTQLSSTPSIFHVVTLSSETLMLDGLTSNKLLKDTTYYYRVKSVDAAGNATESEENSFVTNEDGAITIASVGSGVASVPTAATATTDTTAPVISGILSSTVTPFGATITFSTNKDTVGFVGYGETTSYDGSGGDAVYAGTHSFVVKGLRMGTTYHFKVTAIDRSGNLATSPDQTFKTNMLAQDLGKLTALDSIDSTAIQNQIDNLIQSALPSLNPPFIDTPVVTNIGESGATITWNTNVPSFGSIVYATDATYVPKTYGGENTEIGATKKTAHSVTLSNLTSNTTYHYSVKSYVFQQVPGQSSDYTFITQAAKVQATVQDKKKDSFHVTWTTDVPSSSIVEYRKAGASSFDKITDETLSTYHDVLLANLTPATTYEVKAYGLTKSGNIVELKDTLTVTTSQDIIPPKITNFKVDSTLIPSRSDRIQTVVSWKTDEPATSVVRYEEGSGSPGAVLANKQEDTTTFVMDHVVILTTLKPGAIYRFQVSSTDDAGNTTTLPISTIVTPTQSQSIVDVIFKNFGDTFSFIK